MWRISEIFGTKTERIKRFRGYGYSAEGAQYHAEKRIRAWEKLQNSKERPVNILEQELIWKLKSLRVIECDIICVYSYATAPEEVPQLHPLQTMS